MTKADKDALKENSRVLENKLADFGVQGRVVDVHPGPVITRYEFEPASGVRIPATRLSSVVFPDPLGPITATFSFLPTANSGISRRNSPDG